MRSSNSFKRACAVFAGAVATALVASSSASAVELNGGWAPFDRCPVDDPLVLNTDGISNGGTGSICIAANSPSGSIKLGKLEAQATGATNLQTGGQVAGGEVTLVDGVGGTVISDPVKVKGGLLNISCGSGNDPLGIRAICRTLLEDNVLNKVTATVESAGAPTDFNIIAGLLVGEPIMTLPVKIHLQNPLLGGNCYIGSDSNPILLRPANIEAPAGADFGTYALNGDPADGPDGLLGSITTYGATQGDSTFEVPKAKGCGLLNLFDGAINNKVGLPSPSGANELVLNDASASLMIPALSDGEVPGTLFSQGWHSAVLP